MFVAPLLARVGIGYYVLDMTSQSNNAMLSQVIKHSTDAELEEIVEHIRSELRRRLDASIDHEAVKRFEARMPRNWRDD